MSWHCSNKRFSCPSQVVFHLFSQSINQVHHLVQRKTEKTLLVGKTGVGKENLNLESSLIRPLTCQLNQKRPPTTSRLCFVCSIQLLEKRSSSAARRNRLERGNKTREVASSKGRRPRRQDRLRLNNSGANNNRKC